jgi:hypothetical protein
MNTTSSIARVTLFSAASALVLFVSGCDRAKDAPVPAAVTEPAAAPANPAAALPGDDDGHAQAGKDCAAAGANCTEAERAQGHREGMAMEREAHADGMKMGQDKGMPMKDDDMPMAKPKADPAMKADPPMNDHM